MTNFRAPKEFGDQECSFNILIQKNIVNKAFYTFEQKIYAILHSS